MSELINYPQDPGWKTAATETSREAAQSSKERATTLREQCARALECAPATADEIATTLGVSILSVRPRISELVAMNRAAATGVRRKNASGKTAVVWAVQLIQGEFQW